MNYIFGLFVASLSIFLALNHLNQGVERYWDFVAFSMVLGGTFAVSLIILPWKNYRKIFNYFGKLILHWSPSRRNLVEKCLELYQIHKSGQKIHDLDRSRIEYQILADGFEFLSLGIPPERIKLILQERAHQHFSSGEEVGNSIRSLAKYPPAFGLTGTVLGLVELMRAVSQGMEAKDTGIKMAIALVATLYGLLISNLVINPAGEQIFKILVYEEKLCEISIQTVLLAAEDVSLLEAQEVLNSMVNSHERVDFFHTIMSEAA